MAVTASRDLPRLAAVLAVGVFAFLPMARLPAFYDSFLYLVFFWISLSTSWALLSGFAGYFSLGHAAFFGAGMYTTAVMTTKFQVPFLLTLPVAAVLPALVAVGIGAVVFRLRRLRGELFALLTLAVTFVIATIILNTPIDGGGGIFMSAVPLPAIMPTPTGSIYALGFVLCVATLAIAWKIAHSRLGVGLFAIHDDEDVAEAKGVPTFRYKLAAFALSAGIAGAVGGVHAMYVGFITVAGTFDLTVPLYVVLMSVIGGSRSWFGPAIGAAFITTLLYAFISGGEAMVGRAIVGLILILSILWLPDGLVPAVKKWLGRRRAAAARPPIAEVSPIVPAARPVSERALLQVRGANKHFGGLQALRAIDLDVREGEILGLVGPNGSGKTTLINIISGFYPLSGGTITVDGVQIGRVAAHDIARRGVARTYQIPRPFANMTVLENVILAATFGGPPRRAAEIRDEALHWTRFTGLAGKQDVLPAGLNLHERKFLELARALAAKPKLLLLDEVLSGLNSAEVDNAIRLVRAIRAQGATIVFVEHMMRAVVELSDRIAVLNEGRLFALGLPRDVMRDPRVVSIYLGKAYAA
jgi:branched-chain amino acid transport system permease protein